MWTRRLRIGLVLLAGVSMIALLAVVAERFLATRDAKNFQLLAQDWKRIHFETSPALWRGANGGSEAIDWTGGGTFTGTAQYVSHRIVGWSRERPLLGDARLTAEAELTLFDVAGFVWATQFDAETGLFVVKLLSSEGRLTTYRPPFGEIPAVLAGRVAYRSPGRELLKFQAVEGYRGDAILPYVEVLANVPVAFGWNLRRGCRIVLDRRYDSRTARKSWTSLEEDCPPRRPFPSPADRDLDGKTELRLTAYHTLEQQQTLLVLPRGFEVSAGGRVLTNQTGDRYLAILHNTDQVTQLSLHPLDRTFAFSVHSVPRLGDLDETLAVLSPGTRHLTVEGAVGKVAVGLARDETDELSEVSAWTVDWPEIRWRLEAVTGDDGVLQPRPYLQALGRSDRVTLNGEELLLSRWASMSAEVRGVLIGTLLTLLGWSVLFLLERRWRGPALGAPTAPSLAPPNPPSRPATLELLVGLAGLWLLGRRARRGREDRVERNPLQR